MSEAIKVLFRVTDRCNLNCRYCFAREYSQGKDAPKELVLKTADMVKGAEHVIWIWHGAEPTVCGVDFYKQMNEELRERGISDISMQSNGVVLWHRDWLDFLKQDKMNISISYDGRYQDVMRGHKVDVERSIGALAEAHIGFGVITVIGEHNAKDLCGLYDDMKTAGVKYWQFNTIFPSPRSSFIPTNMARDYEHSVFELFCKWAEDPEPISIRNFEEFIPYMVGAGHYFCTFSGSCHEEYISVTTDGDIAVCDRWFDHYAGNINDFSSIDEVFSSPWRLQMAEAKRQRVERCKQLGCPFTDLCQGGCPRNALDSGDINMPSKEDCYERASFIAGVVKGLERYEPSNISNPILASIYARYGIRNTRMVGRIGV